MNIKDEMSKIGYNLEELYFEKVNRELINKIKSKQSDPSSESQEHQQQMGQVIQFKPKVQFEEIQKKKAA